ncbi:GGDEF domain-containing protein [Roseibium sp. RKSG952]|uniref:GGDEF domain-containing protein n=1 Tax=Roseibium sp. RKSG952 TaxID=2529384 RepID=UPI0012BBD2FA|nr:GGDEF domain-containing protein [Roseibium sp. RKSG952]MTH95142.1 GGDEF domain-containing protein [Roseibium sp. RKSG952]
MGFPASRSERRNPFVVALAAGFVLTAAVVATLNGLIDRQTQIAIRHNAEARAEKWASSFTVSTPAFQEMVEHGFPEPEHVAQLQSSFGLVDVMHFVTFNKDGVETFVSEPGLRRPVGSINDKALSVYRSGNVLTFIHKRDSRTRQGLSGANRYVEVYMPATLPSGERIGAIEVYVNVTDLDAALHETFRSISWYLVFGTITILLIPAVAYIRSTREVMRKDKELLELTRYDQLTGVLNRNSVSDILQGYFMREGGAEELGILFVDVDFFKQVNDQFGHHFGDMLLKHIAGILTSSVRKDTDTVGRYGGDEFIVLCPDMNIQALREAYHRMMASAKAPFCYSDKTYTPSLSIGAYIATSRDIRRSALHKADLAVYQAKRLGRGQVVEYSEQLEGLFDSPDQKKTA